MKRTIIAIIGALGLGTAMAETTETIYLSGSGCDDGRMWKFLVDDGMRKNEKSRIRVPSCWEQEGFGSYTYGRWYTQEGGAPSTETGTYTLDFTVPKSWEGKVVELTFEGVMTDAEVWVNGVMAGDVHQGGFTPFSYDVSDKVSYGKKNRLKVRVSKESSDGSINAAERKADWWLFGGIYRPVTISAKPVDHIERASVDARADGTVNIQILTRGSRGKKIRGKIAELGESEAATSGDSSVVTLRYEKPALWNLEQPNLYTLHLELEDVDGETLHSVDKRIGFRTIEFRPKDGFYLNGKKLQIKGVNRHCFYAESGRTTSATLDLEDVRLIKGMNANAIRSHYPPDTHLLDICDSLGMLYLEELPGWQDAYSDAAGARILKEMVVRDASHPCIFAWSNGNEGGYNYTLDSLFGVYDVQRRHVVHAWALWDGVDAHHYPAYQTGVWRLDHGQNVFMPTEFLHSQYDKGGGASLRDFWDNWRESPLFAGGFIWAWADEGVSRRDRNGAIDTDGPNGPDGIVGPYREKEGSYWAVRDVWSPLQIDGVTVNDKWDGSLYVRNDYMYTDLSECSLRWEWQSVRDGSGTMHTVDSGTMRLPSGAPGEKRRVKVPGARAGGEQCLSLRVDLLSPGEDTLRTYTWAAFDASTLYGKSEKTSTGRATVQSNDGTVSLAAADVECTFDAKTGRLKTVKKGGKEHGFGNGPVPVGFKAELKSLTTRTEGADAIAVAYYAGGIDSIVWRMKPTGTLEMDATLLNDKSGHGYKGKFLNDNARNVGLTFSYPEEQCAGMKWMGNGPYRVWRNRIDGTRWGVWENDYNNTVTGEVKADTARWKNGGPKPETHLVYPEFKGYYANMYWAEIESEESPLRINSASDGLYYRIFTPEEPEYRRGGKATMEAFPEGDLSFMLDISPIQSYKPLSQLGPDAMTPTIRINKGDEGMPLRLRFEFR